MHPEAYAYMLDELEKISLDMTNYRKVQGVLLDKEIPYIRKLPQGEEGKARIRELLNKAEARTTRWSHSQAAVKDLPLEEMGFKPTRVAIPLPGEKPGTKTWRSGSLHAHKTGPMYVVHEDKAPPKSIFGSIKHVIKDVPPALVKRFKGVPPPIIVPTSS
jgi:hypothetical protein